MMYANKIAVAIKVGGRVLREAKSQDSERDDTVFIPFGSEYTVFVKNMNSVRALVRLSIDGTDATEGISIIVPANSGIDLERFIKASNMNAGLKFKFIERTHKIEDGPRGIKVEDGLIRIEYEFEREPVKIIPAVYYSAPYLNTHDSGFFRSKGISDRTLYSTSASASSASASAQTTDWYKGGAQMSTNDKGITVGGGVSNQEFVTGSWFPTDGVKHVMIIKVLGTTDAGKVIAPVTVKTKMECPTCAMKNKFGTKFCAECGTGLQEV